MPLDKMNLQALPNSVQSWFSYLINSSFYIEQQELTVTVGDIPANDTLVVDYPLEGVRTTNSIVVTLTSTPPAGMLLAGAKPETDNIEVTFVNPTASDIAVGSLTLRFLVFKS
jgi:hypothetical protein